MDAPARELASFTHLRKAPVTALLMRARWHEAQVEDERLKANARSNSYADNQEALDEPNRIAEEAPECGGFGAGRGRSGARLHLRQSRASEEANVCDEDQLLVAAAPVAAASQVLTRFSRYPGRKLPL